MITLLTGFFKIVISILEVFFNVLMSLFPEKRKTGYDADFLAPGGLLSRFNKGFSINGKSLTIDTSFKNILVLGQLEEIIKKLSSGGWSGRVRPPARRGDRRWDP